MLFVLSNAPLFFQALLKMCSGFFYPNLFKTSRVSKVEAHKKYDFRHAVIWN